jgi:hypothetical protein
VAACFGLGIGVKAGEDVVAATFAREEEKRYLFVLGERRIKYSPSHSPTMVCR